MAAAGQRPARTLVYAGWDAEEPGLIGSTEWVEKQLPVLDEKAVAYINTDGNSRGFASVGGSHTLEPFFNEVLKEVTDPQTGVSLDERLRARIEVEGPPEQQEELASRQDIRIAPLGSGSDYTPFLQHAGIASANLAFGGEGRDGSYHTLYDTYEHYSRFRDPGFAYGVALADLAGNATLRLANAPVLPFRFSGLADNLSFYLGELTKLADDERKAAQRTNRMLREGTFDLALDPERSLSPPPAVPEVPHFNFAPLMNAIDRVTENARALDAALDTLGADSDIDLAALNARLFRSERALSSREGLPGRDWYRHQIYAPGFYTGYGVKTLPRVREAIEAELYDQVDAEIAITAQVLEAFADYLSETRSLIE